MEHLHAVEIRLLYPTGGTRETSRSSQGTISCKSLLRLVSRPTGRWRHKWRRRKQHARHAHRRQCHWRHQRDCDSATCRAARCVSIYYSTGYISMIVMARFISGLGCHWFLHARIWSSVGSKGYGESLWRESQLFLLKWYRETTFCLN